MKTNYILLLTILIFSMSASAQTSVLEKNITWMSYENIDLYSETTVPDTFSITTDSDKIVLKNSERERTFLITNVEGNWSNPAIDGKLVCSATISQAAGTIILERTNGITAVTIDFSQRKGWIKRKYIIKD